MSEAQVKPATEEAESTFVPFKIDGDRPYVAFADPDTAKPGDMLGWQGGAYGDEVHTAWMGEQGQVVWTTETPE